MLTLPKDDARFTWVYLMSLKGNFLHNHLDFFPENLSNVCEEEGKYVKKGREHHHVNEMDKRYHGNWPSTWCVITAGHCTENNKMHHIEEKAILDPLQKKGREKTNK